MVQASARLALLRLQFQPEAGRDRRVAALLVAVHRPAVQRRRELDPAEGEGRRAAHVHAVPLRNALRLREADQLVHAHDRRVRSLRQRDRVAEMIEMAVAAKDVVEVPHLLRPDVRDGIVREKGVEHDLRPLVRDQSETRMPVPRQPGHARYPSPTCLRYSSGPSS